MTLSEQLLPSIELRAAILCVGWRLCFYLSFLIITRVVTKESIIIMIDNISKSVMMITPFLL